MLRVIVSLFSLLLAVAVLLVGMGALGTLLGVRAGMAHFGAPVTGVVMGAYFLGYIIGSFLCPPLLRRVGHIRAFAVMSAIVTAVALTHGLYVEPFAWFALRVINGTCMMGLYMIVESWLNAITPNERRGQVFAVYMATTLVALGAGQYLILVGDLTSTVPFALAAICISLAVVPIALTRIGQPEPVVAPSLSLKRLYRLAPLGVVGTLCSGLITGAFWGMGPLFAQRLGLPPRGIALFMSATIFGGALLQWPIGRLSDNSDRRKVLAVACLGGVTAALAAYGVALAMPDILFAIAFIYGGFAFTVYSLSAAHTNDHLGKEHTLEAARSLLLLNGIGAVIGPMLAGLLMDKLGTGSLLIYFATVLALLGIYALYRTRVHIPVIPSESFKPMADNTSQVVLEMDPRVEDQVREDTPTT